MRILGIETSCDETAAAVVENGNRILSNVVASQINTHAEYGGVVPEVAARNHVDVMLPVIEKAFTEAKITWNDIDALAVTSGPGLVGSLLIGALTAQILSELKNKPLIPINHVEAHCYASFLEDRVPSFPILCLIVSGGHTQLVIFKNHGQFQVLGRTRDDAAGEAFDKVAKILGLPYPGGPSISKAALKGDKQKYPLPKPKIAYNPFDFSFSGLKTAVLRTAQEAAGQDFRTPSYAIAPLLSRTQINDLAASFEHTAVEILADRLAKAYTTYSPSSVVIGGGVAANHLLRKHASARLPIAIKYAPLDLCTDNAAMIASLGYYYFKQKKIIIPTDLKIDPVMSM